MLSRNDFRIAAALAISMIIHGTVLVWNYGAKQDPVIGTSRKTLTFQLAARHSAAPENELQTVMPQAVKKETREQQQDIPAKKPEQPPEVRNREPSAAAAPPVQSVPERIEAAVKNDSQTIQAPVAQETQSKVPLQKAGEAEPVLVTREGQTGNPVIVKARPLYRENPAPAYPGKARHRRLEGTVVLEVQVGSGGSVESLRIKDSSGHRILDQAALSAVREWVFEPGRRNGVRTAMTVLVPVRFTLQ